ncbi:MAG: COX15/CtaA family protein [Pirellulales bacterium]
MTHSASQHRTPSRGLHALAVLLVCATFPLIWVGGLVTTYDAGMAVPDWPSTYGYNLFLYPWQTWVAGPFDLFIEHGHRLLGAGVGLITLVLVAAAWLWDDRPWLRLVALTALVAVIGQGALGGMRVLFDDRQLAMIHGCVGPAFFALAASLAVFTSRSWHTTEPLGVPEARRFQRLALLTAVLAYLQLVLGAGLRHLPVDATVGYFRALVLFHLLMAAAVLVHAVLLVRGASALAHWGLFRRSLLLLALVLGQWTLGAGTWIVKYGWPSWFADWSLAAGYTIQTNSLTQALTTTAHVANGSLILAWSVTLAVRALRMFPVLVDAQDGTTAVSSNDSSRPSAMLRGVSR